MWLHVVENELVHAKPNSSIRFGNLMPYLHRKDILTYKVIVHVRYVTDFDPADPTPPLPPLDSDDDDSGHDGNPDHHHFSSGQGPHIQGFACHWGIIDGEHVTDTIGNGARHVSGQDQQSQAVAPQKKSLVADADPIYRESIDRMIDLTVGRPRAHPKQDQSWGPSHFEFDSFSTGQELAIGQHASDPMVIEAGLLSVETKPIFAASVQKNTNYGGPSEDSDRAEHQDRADVRGDLDALATNVDHPHPRGNVGTGPLSVSTLNGKAVLEERLDKDVEDAQDVTTGSAIGVVLLGTTSGSHAAVYAEDQATKDATTMEHAAHAAAPS